MKPIILVISIHLFVAAAAATQVSGHEPGTPTPSGSLENAARRALDAGETEQAVALAERWSRAQPGRPEAHLLHGQALLAKLQEASLLKKLSLSKQVRTAYQNALTLDPGHVETHVALTRYYLNAPAIAGGGLDRAEAQIDRLASFDRRRALLLRADLAQARDLPQQAIDALSTAYALDRDDPAVAYRLGVRLQEAERWDAAFDHLESSFEQTGDLRLLYLLGRNTALAATRQEEGIAALERYLTHEPNEPGFPSAAAAHWRIGMLEEQLGRPAAARQRFERALALDSEFQPAKDSLAALTTGSTHDKP